jgi:hypothetical protein
MNRFYRAATAVLVTHDAVIDKLISDEVMALFIPGSLALTTGADRLKPVPVCSKPSGTCPTTGPGWRWASASTPGLPT